MPGEAKHTPGPWRYDENLMLIMAPDGLCIFRYGQTPEERAANFRLMAAAPELLSACQDLLDTWAVDPVWSSEDDPAVKARDAARLAVAKAISRENDNAS